MLEIGGGFRSFWFSSAQDESYEPCTISYWHEQEREQIHVNTYRWMSHTHPCIKFLPSLFWSLMLIQLGFVLMVWKDTSVNVSICEYCHKLSCKNQLESSKESFCHGWEYGGLVGNTFASHLQGRGFEFCFRSGCAELACSPCALGFSPPVQRYALYCDWHFWMVQLFILI